MILSNPAIKKYFGCDTRCGFCMYGERCPATALRVLEAMEAKIRPGDDMLQFWNDAWIVNGAAVGFVHEDFHPDYLLLPPQHQKRAEVCECMCHNVACMCCKNGGHVADKPAPPDPVEEKIKEIVEKTSCKNECCSGPVNWSRYGLLSELVALAKRQAKDA